ncbi:hypothetical protein C8Q79DRAFT_1104511 [Trametes meyenii]|nr:hypothetical protein C8Q79DRAFT_1104511 [Trametes meyenii]
MDAIQEMLDWEIVPEDWWKTSFKAISWSYKTKPGYPRPPHYHNLLARGRRRRITVDVPKVEDDIDLNNALSGVRAVEDTLKWYEDDVSIRSSDQLNVPDSPIHASLATLAKDDWDEKVRGLLGGILELRPLPEVDTPSPDVPLWDLDHLDGQVSAPSSPCTTGLTESVTSADSEPPPSTPKPTKTSYARVVSNDPATSPTVLSPLPSKLLSAAALTFIPSTPSGPDIHEPITPPLTSGSNSSGDSPFSSPTYNFHFPSLTSTSPTDRRESRSLPPSLQKDESGFYVEVAETEDIPNGATQSLNATRSTTPRRPSAALLPAFLTDGSPSPRSRNSKTREIVDRIRSSGSSGSHRKAKKAERARRQPSGSASKDSDAGTAAIAKADDAVDGWISGVVSEHASARSTDTDDGWITQGQVPSQQHQHQNQHQQPDRHKSKHGHGHKRSSGSISVVQSSASFSPTSQASNLSVPHTPARVAGPLPAMSPLYAATGAMSYPVSPYGVPYSNGNPAAFMPIQYPMQARGPQWSMGFQPGVYPMYQPFGVMPSAPYGMVPVAPIPPPSAFFDGKGKSGGTLVQW